MTASPCEIDDDEQPAAGDLRSYGRRRGRKLSSRQARLMQELLPGISPPIEAHAPDDLAAALFSGPGQDVWLEIGFGGGEHLLWHARRQPGVGFIGAEPFEDGVVKVLAAVEDEGLRNVRVHADDVRKLLRWLPPASLARAFVLFPDPWPKRRHQKRRLVNRDLLALLARALREGAELRVATDIGDYARTMFMAFQASPEFEWMAQGPQDWRVRPDDWPPTRYEAKAFREGRRAYYLTFVRRGV
ncbi:MAG: tRNA (guanosine(46)-N7)-methyltransferase TrmB [Proteobacteria bacterium]|nr:tRNA (guanosine(46)-N7)-methyltransferase TrmB [Pseudomonadota bacterium]